MTAYMLVEIAIKDETGYNEFSGRVPAVVERYGGRFITRSGSITTVAGDWKPDRIVIIAFDTIDDLRNCFRSEEYAELAKIREKATETRAFIIAE